LIECDAAFALDPGEGVLLADRTSTSSQSNAGRGSPVGTRLAAGRFQGLPLTFSNTMPVELSVLDDELLGTR